MPDGLRLGIVDDHPAIALGVFASLDPVLRLSGKVTAATVEELLGVVDDLDVVLLDLRLQDDSVPADNVARLVARRWPVLLYTQVRQPAVVATCFRAGAQGVVGKHEDISTLADAIVSVAGGDQHVNADLAAALQVLLEADAPTLAPREAQVVSLYATGLPLKSVARRLGVAEETAKEYLTRVKRKYLKTGRPVGTRTELYQRAVEDGLLDPYAE